jgi:heme exporter protein A
MPIPFSLQAIDLGCIRHNTLLFKKIDFTLFPGEALVVEGVNGIGKSSLLRLLAGLSAVEEGHFYWQGHSVHAQLIDYWQQLHYLSHFNGLKLQLSVLENLRLAARLALLKELPASEEILSLLKLREYSHTLVRYLSAGQKRRLALARLFLIPKPLWILDEPLTALDDQGQQLFQHQLDRHLQHQGICLLSSHHALPFKHQRCKTVRLVPC